MFKDGPVFIPYTVADGKWQRLLNIHDPRSTVGWLDSY
ncbi:hypothetical protein AM1_3359 [Acaryochloris marina MBIC11017]|uniref:Uncharacterized protein n=1 Tax=Acaryochloris marina (strain MBIC 11017) TaxID=329726 RepID=B0C006_ACAM1|nr:hypothetical protein AM1_3359 [Acaryochloris marina MBIC11017]